MRTCALLFIMIFLSMAIMANADVVGSRNSNDNDLSAMTTAARSSEGHCPTLFREGEDGREALPETVYGDEKFLDGTFPGGWYKGFLVKGDFVFFKREVVQDEGEWHYPVRHGRCSNELRNMKYWVPRPKPPAPTPPCENKPPPSCPPPVIKICCPPYPAPRCSMVVNLTTNVNVTVKQAAPKRQAPTLTPLGATTSVVQTRGGTIGGGVVSTPTEGQKLCPPYPTKPIPPPLVPPAPPMH